MKAVSNLFGQTNAYDLYLLLDEGDLYPNLALHLQENSDIYRFAAFSLPHLSGEWMSEERKSKIKIFETIDEMTAYIHAFDHGEIEMEER